MSDEENARTMAYLEGIKQKDAVDSLIYRTDSEDVINRITMSFQGYVFDAKKREYVYIPEMRKMNDKGVYGMKYLLDISVNKVTSLTKWHSQDHLDRMARVHFKNFALVLIKHRRDWEVVDPDLILKPVESLVYQCWLKAIGGFENSNVSASIHVMERRGEKERTMEYQEDRKGGIMSMLRGGNRG